jgi:hypothetical protein
MTFDEAVASSSVIVKGYLADLLQGRAIRSAVASPSSDGINTVFLKIVPSNVLKGNLDDYYLVEILGPADIDGLMDELKVGRYGGELLLLLRAATNWLTSPEITHWPDARAEWELERPLYDLTRRSMLFALTGTGRLASPLDASRELDDLYLNYSSLAALEAHIATIQAEQPFQGGDTEDGFRDWGETGPIARVEPELKEGLNQILYSSGQPRFEFNVVNGELKEGRHWHQSGQLLMEANFEDGERVGCRAWTPNGVPTSCEAPHLFQF